VFTTKKKIVLIALLILALLFILVNYNREIIRSYISEVVKQPSTRVHLINIAKVAIPLKNLILMRNIDDKIALLKSSGSCVFCDLSQGNFKGIDLEGVDLRYANLSGADLSYANLSGADLSSNSFRFTGRLDTILQDANLTGANLSGVDLRNKDLTGVNLSGVDLSKQDLTGTILIQANLSEANLSGVDLSNQDLTGTILRLTNLSGANLDGVDLRNKDLTGVNLSGVDLSNQDLTGTITEGAEKIEISLKNPSNSNFPASNEIQNLNVTKYDLSGDVQYLTTKEGFLFESKNNESRLVLDLNKDALFPFTDFGYNGGLLGVASNEEFVYISYTSKGPDFDIEGDEGKGVDTDFSSLVVDEYSIDFKNVRNIIKIDGFLPTHYGGTLVFDHHGRLYLSTGDGAHYYQSNNAQNLNSLRGKILRLDVSKLKQDPEIVAFGLRNPFGVTIDSRKRMFIVQCGDTVETVYLLNDLYSGIPVNFGWRVFAGSKRDKIGHPLMFKDVLAPIFEYTTRPGCATGGVYLDDIESFLFADFHGTIRLLKQKENGDWYLFHEYKQENNIWNLGLDNKTKKIFVAPNNLELEISVEQVKHNQ